MGAGAIVGFWIVNCQYKLVQRAFINRNYAIDSELRKVGIAEVLRGGGSLQIVGTASPGWRERDPSLLSRARMHFSELLSEACLPHTFGLYLFILVCLIAEAIVLL